MLYRGTAYAGRRLEGRDCNRKTLIHEEPDQECVVLVKLQAILRNWRKTSHERPHPTKGETVHYVQREWGTVAATETSNPSMRGKRKQAGGSDLRQRQEGQRHYSGKRALLRKKNAGTMAPSSVRVMSRGAGPTNSEIALRPDRKEMGGTHLAGGPPPPIHKRALTNIKQVKKGFRGVVSRRRCAKQAQGGVKRKPFTNIEDESHPQETGPMQSPPA